MLKGVNKEVQKKHLTDLLSSVELISIKKKAVKRLSGGQKRRLSIAVALCSKPAVILLDEPSSGLDPATRRQLWNVILASRTGRAMILTTHAMEEAESLASRVAIMASGKLRCIGTIDHL